MRRILIYIVLGLSIAQYAIANPLGEGVEAYKEADYPRAIELFTQALDEGEPTAEAYYNLASAYYKSGELASAILNYERAYRIDPSDADTRFNIGLVNSQLPDKMEATPAFFLSSWLRSMSHWFTLSVWRWLSALFIVLLLIGLFLYIRGRAVEIRRIGFYGGLVSVALAVLVNILAYQSYHFTYDTKEAILMPSVITVKSSPDASGKDIVVLHGGIKVEILQHLSGFSEVRLPDGTIGWVSQQAYEVINNFKTND